MTWGETDELSCSRLGDLLELVIDYRGKTPKKLGGDFADSGVPVISAIHIKNGRIAWEERERFVTQEMFKKWMKDPLRKGDVLLTSEAPLGEVALVPNDDDVVLSQRLFALRPNPELLDAPYLMYFLKSSLGQRELQDRATGSTVVGIRQAELMNISVQHPSLRRQKLIGQVLSNLDFKIDKNQELSTTLERMAVDIFKSWFIDFDPVKAKMAGDAPVGMDAETAALFPDSMEESELGLVPRGWRTRLLTDVAFIRYGAAFSSKKFNSDGLGLPLIRIRDLRTQNPSIYTDEKIPRGFAARAGSLLVGMDGEFEPVIWFGEEAWVNQRVCMVEPNEDCDVSFLQFHLKPILKKIEHGTVGTTVLHLGKKELDSISILYPSRELVSAYSQISSSILGLRISLAKESTHLRSLRDSLFPRLVSGELEIPEEMLAA